MSERYEAHLAHLHARQTIATELLNAILHKVSPERVLSKQRIIAGEVNEVYDVSFANGLDVIVRIARDDTKNSAHFEQEQWAIHECSVRGAEKPPNPAVQQTASRDHRCLQLGDTQAAADGLLGS